MHHVPAPEVSSRLTRNSVALIREPLHGKDLASECESREKKRVERVDVAIAHANQRPPPSWQHVNAMTWEPLLAFETWFHSIDCMKKASTSSVYAAENQKTHKRYLSNGGRVGGRCLV